MRTTDHLTNDQKRAFEQARESIAPCEKCQGKPWITYEPGCVRSVCAMGDETCTKAKAAPDMELGLLVERINKP